MGLFTQVTHSVGYGRAPQAAPPPPPSDGFQNGRNVRQVSVSPHLFQSNVFISQSSYPNTPLANRSVQYLQHQQTPYLAPASQVVLPPGTSYSFGNVSVSNSVSYYTPQTGLVYAQPPYAATPLAHNVQAVLRPGDSFIGNGISVTNAGTLSTYYPGPQHRAPSPYSHGPFQQPASSPYSDRPPSYSQATSPREELRAVLNRVDSMKQEEQLLEVLVANGVDEQTAIEICEPMDISQMKDFTRGVLQQKLQDLSEPSKQGAVFDRDTQQALKQLGFGGTERPNRDALNGAFSQKMQDILKDEMMIKQEFQLASRSQKKTFSRKVSTPTLDSFTGVKKKGVTSTPLEARYKSALHKIEWQKKSLKKAFQVAYQNSGGQQQASAARPSVPPKPAAPVVQPITDKQQAAEALGLKTTDNLTNQSLQAAYSRENQHVVREQMLVKQEFENVQAGKTTSTPNIDAIWQRGKRAGITSIPLADRYQQVNQQLERKKQRLTDAYSLIAGSK